VATCSKLVRCYGTTDLSCFASFLDSSTWTPLLLGTGHRSARTRRLRLHLILQQGLILFLLWTGEAPRAQSMVLTVIIHRHVLRPGGANTTALVHAGSVSRLRNPGSRKRHPQLSASPPNPPNPSTPPKTLSWGGC
jgi:hypothetical protein